MTDLVFIPGLQGRWEYMRRAVDALAESFHVIAISLADEPGADADFDPDQPMASYVAQIEWALAERGLAKAVICGVSFGGLVALRFAADHPERTAALVLASTPGPRWTTRPRHLLYARFPRLAAPLFFAGLPGRLRGEIAAAIPRMGERLRFVMEQVRTVLRAPVSPSRMARRALLIDHADAGADCARISVPTLIVTGEALLDRVVPVQGTCEYAQLISVARSVQIDHTGHLGCITRPRAFAAALAEFVRTSAAEDAGHHAA